MYDVWAEHLKEIINDEHEKVLIHLKDGEVIDTGSKYRIDWFVKHEYDVTILSYTIKLTGERERYYIIDNSILFFKTYR